MGKVTQQARKLRPTRREKDLSIFSFFFFLFSSVVVLSWNLDTFFWLGEFTLLLLEFFWPPNLGEMIIQCMLCTTVKKKLRRKKFADFSEKFNITKFSLRRFSMHSFFGNFVTIIFQGENRTYRGSKVAFGREFSCRKLFRQYYPARYFFHSDYGNTAIIHTYRVFSLGEKMVEFALQIPKAHFRYFSRLLILIEFSLTPIW